MMWRNYLIRKYITEFKIKTIIFLFLKREDTLENKKKKYF